MIIRYERTEIAKEKWERMDSNHRRRTPTGLQPVPFGHLGTLPLRCRSTLSLRLPHCHHGRLPRGYRHLRSATIPQKTAPCMTTRAPHRCSGRLIQPEGGGDTKRGRRPATRRSSPPGFSRVRQAARAESRRVAAGLTNAVRRNSEIGRASCRERV